MFLSYHVRVSEWIHTLQLPEYQRTPYSKQAQNMKFKWLKLDLNPEPVSSSTNTQPLVECSFYELRGSGFESICSYLNFRFRACFEQGVPWKQATPECGFTLKRESDMTRTYSQMHRSDEYSEHSSTICPVWPNGWVFVSELSGSGFEWSCSYFNFRFCTYFKQGFPWHWVTSRVWIHSETRTGHDKNIQLNVPYRKVLRTQLNHLASLAKWLSVLFTN